MPTTTQRDEADYRTAVARQAEILARPDLVALIERARTLTEQERTALHAAHLPHYRIHRRTMSDLWHRFVHAVGAPHWRDTFSALEDIARVAQAGRDRHADSAWSAADTVRDVAKVFIMGDLLSDSERLVFTAPWLAVFGELPEPATRTVGRGDCPGCGAPAGAPAGMPSVVCVDCGVWVPMVQVPAPPTGPYPYPPVTVATPDGPVTYRPGVDPFPASSSFVSGWAAVAGDAP